MFKLREGTIKRIHVDKTRIARRASGPVLTVQTSKGPIKGSEVRILGPSTLHYTPDAPLACGARAYITTRAAVEIEDAETREDRRKHCDN